MGLLAIVGKTIIFYILVGLLILAIQILITYYVIRIAVKHGTEDAIKETNLEKQIEKGTTEAMKRIDYRVLARIFADEYKKASEKKEDT